MILLLCKCITDNQGQETSLLPVRRSTINFRHEGKETGGGQEYRSDLRPFQIKSNMMKIYWEDKDDTMKKVGLTVSRLVEVRSKFALVD